MNPTDMENIKYVCQHLGRHRLDEFLQGYSYSDLLDVIVESEIENADLVEWFRHYYPEYWYEDGGDVIDNSHLEAELSQEVDLLRRLA